MPFNRAKYPPDWEVISKRIRFERAGGKCEYCGVENSAVGARDINGDWWNEDQIHGMNANMGQCLFGEVFPDMVRVVLTVAHWPDPDPMNCADDNLLALCQRCHNRLDAPMRAEHAKETRARKRAASIRAAGQLGLFEE